MKYFLTLGALLAVFLVPSTSHAAMTINSVLLNGVASSKIQVNPGTNITATVNATLTSGTKWKATSWGMATSSNSYTVTCVNSKNAKDGTRNSPDGTYTENITIKAPATPGLYTVTFLGDSSNNCGQTITGSSYSVAQSIQVGGNMHPPVIAPHSDEVVTSATPTVVTYTKPTATDDLDQSVPVSCSPASGSTFPLGDTTVTCTASDSSGNQAIPTTFKVTVVQPAGIPYVMNTQSDASYLCSPTWQACFTGGNSIKTINLGQGSSFGNGSLKSVTIAKDETSPFVSQPWIIQFECFTDASYSTHCTDWLQPNANNGNVSYVAAEFTTATTDNKFWTADFTDPSHESNFGGTSPVVFKQNYYYRLIINDNGWGIGAYGSQSLGLPYYAINGLTL
jgi:hypothetical protein